MTNEEARIVMECLITNIVGDFASEEMPNGAKHTVEALETAKEAIEAAGKAGKYMCKLCKHYDCENDHCLHLDIYCEENFYCKDWRKE